MQPHPAVARIVVPERSATSYGTGTLIDVREQYGLVVTNWHVIRDGTGPPEVVFPNGFRSKGRPLKLDANWDLAAVVIWRPPIEPVKISRDPPRPGDWLTICGYGQGDYREAVGRCTQYYAPNVNHPHELLELDVEARQGDSGGPILNARGELAGVLFGAGRGTTMGSYGGRVHSFLASLAADIGQPGQQTAVAHAPRMDSAASGHLAALPDEPGAVKPATLLSPQVAENNSLWRAVGTPGGQVAPGEHHVVSTTTEDWPTAADSSVSVSSPASSEVEYSSSTWQELSSPPAVEPVSWSELAGTTWTQRLTTLFAMIAGIAVVLKLARLAG